MKRHSDLREFSDDHHGGLVNARRLRRVASGEGGRVARDAALAFLEFWREETGPHFRKEEEVLLPVLARHRQDVESEPVSRMLTQHARIRGLVMELSDQVARDEVLAETLGELGDQLEAHIRLEERVVFPWIEQALPEHALREVALRLAVSKTGRPVPWDSTGTDDSGHRTAPEDGDGGRDRPDRAPRFS